MDWWVHQVSAKRLLAKVHEFSPEAEAEWGDDGMDRILASPHVQCCAVVLPILSQVSASRLRLVNDKICRFDCLIMAELKQPYAPHLSENIRLDIWLEGGISTESLTLGK